MNFIHLPLQNSILPSFRILSMLCHHLYCYYVCSLRADSMYYRPRVLCSLLKVLLSICLLDTLLLPCYDNSIQFERKSNY